MPNCVAFGCRNRTPWSGPGITFHRFPTNPLVRRAWTLAVRRKNWSPTLNCVLCSDHFVESDFFRTTPPVCLKKNAIPSVFKAYPKNLQIDESLLQKMIEDATPGMEETVAENVPAIKVAASSDQELVLGVFEQMKKSSMLPPDGNNVSFVLLEQSPDVGSSKEDALKRKLETYEGRLESYKKKIKLLNQTNRRQNAKITKLKNYIKKLKCSQTTDEDISEDDISEGEIYETLLKHQEEDDADSSED